MKNDQDNPAEENFIGRWYRRKAMVMDNPGREEINTVSDPSSDSAPIATIGPAPESEQRKEKPLTDEDMPDIESLNENSDYSMFMSSGVSEGLRRLALRKLFSGAGFNIRDGLDDYDDDFRNFQALGDILTCDMKHQIEMEEERKRKQEEETELADNREQHHHCDEDQDPGSSETEVTKDDQSPDFESEVEQESEVVAEFNPEKTAG